MPSGKIDSDQRDEISRLYKLEMPEDLYHFWDFCNELNPESPCGKSSIVLISDFFFFHDSIDKLLLLFSLGHKIVLCLVLFHIDALKDTLGLKLVGPFEILAGSHKTSKSPVPNIHLHWRFYYDPPEFQTILLGNMDSQHHLGYYR